MNYEERFGEVIMSDQKQAIEEERIKNKEKLESLEKCVESIKELLKTDIESLEDYQGLVEEIKNVIGELENAY